MILKDLHRRNPDWLRSAGEEMADATEKIGGNIGSLDRR